ncbi:hypothetical protein K7X08_015973 [Anisodus acutangulus]|uniref:Uncharacterized protein n=1 Tax=Anisodus acutangulus TaxID=402998 RepID=A0A9Q1LEN7_9SOLA|nr:hypothetical protein K7X08_015973 [Anisodus acutangulus]
MSVYFLVVHIHIFSRRSSIDISTLLWLCYHLHLLSSTPFDSSVITLIFLLIVCATFLPIDVSWTAVLDSRSYSQTLHDLEPCNVCNTLEA